MDDLRMAENVHQLRPKPGGDSEKITINLGYVDLGHIDLMVEEGFYSNRTDFIRTAIRNQLERHADVVKKSTDRKGLDLGLRHYSREDLEAARSAGEMLRIQVLGLASIALDVTPEQVFVADGLRFTRDPFDALICASAQTAGLPLITRDAEIRGSRTVKVIW